METQFDYSRVISQANAISECEVQLSNQIKSLTQIEEECRNIWQGIAANAFVGKMHELYDIMNKTVVQMADLTSTMRAHAQKIQQKNEQQESWCTAKDELTVLIYCERGEDMSWIYVDFEGMNYINAGFSTAISQMCVLKSKYQRIVEGCDAELLY